VLQICVDRSFICIIEKFCDVLNFSIIQTILKGILFYLFCVFLYLLWSHHCLSSLSVCLFSCYFVLLSFFIVFCFVVLSLCLSVSLSFCLFVCLSFIYFKGNFVLFILCFVLFNLVSALFYLFGLHIVFLVFLSVCLTVFLHCLLFCFLSFFIVFCFVFLSFYLYRYIFVSLSVCLSSCYVFLSPCLSSFFHYVLTLMVHLAHKKSLITLSNEKIILSFYLSMFFCFFVLLSFCSLVCKYLSS